MRSNVLRIAALSLIVHAAESSTVKIVANSDGYQLLRDGKPYYIHGAGGSQKLDVLVASGGNSIRTWSASPEVLDQAQAKGLSVLLGLRVGRPRQGFDYGDRTRVEAQ